MPEKEVLDFKPATRLEQIGYNSKRALGPGSDAYHADHIHVDLAERAHRCLKDGRQARLAKKNPATQGECVAGFPAPVVTWR